MARRVPRFLRAFLGGSPPSELVGTVPENPPSSSCPDSRSFWSYLLNRSSAAATAARASWSLASALACLAAFDPLTPLSLALDWVLPLAAPTRPRSRWKYSLSRYFRQNCSSLSSRGTFSSYALWTAGYMMKICRISSTPSVMRPVRTWRWDCSSDEVPARAIPEIRAYSSSRRDEWVFQKSSSVTVLDSSTRYLCWDRSEGLDASRLDRVTAREVGSSCPKEALVVFPVASSDWFTLIAAEDVGVPFNFRFVPLVATPADTVDDALEGVSKDCRRELCCDLKSFKRSLMSFRIRSSSDRSVN
mmetsp:Transcript_25370/g.59414  ORF Transcript_25370/g.59414 Transcript_25370/m.59414 type:complete len:303 (+) Transcript_25370:1295-2203(+)